MKKKLEMIVLSRKMCTFAVGMNTHVLYISIGTNLATAEQVMAWTKRRLAEAFRGEARYSTIVQTEPINFASERPFTNQLAVIKTTVPTPLAKPLLKSIERQLGRNEADTRRGVVRLDLDLLVLDGEVLKPTDWEFPHIREARRELGIE